MKKFITILLILLSGVCYGQKADSVKVVFDKDGNMIRKVYYSKKQFDKKSDLPRKVKIKYEKGIINKT